MNEADYNRIDARLDSLNDRIDGVHAAIDDIENKLKS